MPASARRFFQHHFLFSSLEQGDVKTVIDAMAPVQKNIGEFVIKQGDTGDHFYVLETGKCEIIVSPPARRFLVRSSLC